MKAYPAQRAEWEAQWNAREAKVRADLSSAADFVMQGLYLSARIKPLITEFYARWYWRVDWDDSMTLEDFPRSPLAGAVSRAVSA